ncbi:MAG: hypothetical protein FWE95_02090 [Planctomycetaceae bacterium]|nr:hypothetical protein [Planctomycetaceae bacterium]
MARTSWHPAFAQAIEHELEDSKDALTFETEHQLTTEPLRIDVLIIKKEKDVVIEKNIAQIFRGFNIVEYKNPEDSVTIEDYHKTHCYSRLYVALNKVDIADMSVTVVVTRHPRKLLGFLKSRYAVRNVQPGIYMVVGDTSPTQILVADELPEEENIWLTSLRSDLTEEQLDRILAAAEGRTKVDAFLHTVIEVNAETMGEQFMRRKKEGVIFSENLDAFFRERYAPLIAEGKAIGVAEGKAEEKTVTARNMLLAFLRGKFGKVPKSIKEAIIQMNDPIALESLAARTGNCKTLAEFAEEL